MSPHVLHRRPLRFRLRQSEARRRAAVSLLSVAVLACSTGRAPAPEPSTPVRALPPDAAPPPPADGLSPAFHAAFAAADGRARQLVFMLECQSTVQRLRASGTFGPAATAPRAVYCLRTADGEPVGGVYDIDSAFTAPRRLTLVRLDGARAKYLAPIDTARLVQAAKLTRDITWEVAPGWKALKRPFTVVPIMPDSAPALEGWVIPSAPRARTVVTGGEIAFVRASTGRMQRIVDHLGTYAVVPVNPTGPVVLTSAEADVAAVADLVTARMLADLGRDVTVISKRVTSMLVPRMDPATGARRSWDHVVRTP